MSPRCKPIRFDKIKAQLNSHFGVMLEQFQNAAKYFRTNLRRSFNLHGARETSPSREKEKMWLWWLWMDVKVGFYKMGQIRSIKKIMGFFIRWFSVTLKTWVLTLSLTCKKVHLICPYGPKRCFEGFVSSRNRIWIHLTARLFFLRQWTLLTMSN